MRYECCAGGMTCNDLWSLFFAAGGIWGHYEPPALPGQSPDGGQGANPRNLSRTRSVRQKIQRKDLVTEIVLDTS